MAALSDRCADPEDGLGEAAVVDDQYGRPTFACDIVEGIL